MVIGMNLDYKHSDHFRRIAPLYRELRETDAEPVFHIVRQLNPLSAIKAADIGCGTGRYTQLLMQRLADKVSSVYCVDQSENMLGELKRNFARHSIRTADVINASAMCLPIRDASLNCIFTFNAIQHFALLEFLRETTRVLQDGGYLFVYSRLRSQNSRSVWGRFFPLFTSKETRLHEVNELEDTIAQIPSLRLRKTQVFEFKRKGTLEGLSERAKNRHYSTFDLYSRGEFNKSLRQFQTNLLDYFGDPNDIQWVDENILLTVQKAG